MKVSPPLPCTSGAAFRSAASILAAESCLTPITVVLMPCQVLSWQRPSERGQVLIGPYVGQWEENKTNNTKKGGA